MAAAVELAVMLYVGRIGSPECCSDLACAEVEQLSLKEAVGSDESRRKDFESLVVFLPLYLSPHVHTRGRGSYKDRS